MVTQGGLLLQIILGGLLSVMVYLVMWWNKGKDVVRSVWTSRFGLRRQDNR